MLAAIYETFAGPIEIRTVPDPSLEPDAVILTVEATGVCRSDYHGWRGQDPDITLPHVPGHELAGTIEEVGSAVTNWRVGQRVTVPFVTGCGDCAECLSGNQHVCDRQHQPGFTHWGSFAERVMIRYAASNLVALPDEVDAVSAASLGCRFTTAWRAVVAQGRTVPGEWLAVHGCGGVGLSAIMIGSAMGARVIGIDIQEDALDLARQMGAEAVLNPREDGRINEAILEITGGGANVSIDALGSAVTCASSIRSLRKRGRHIQVGLMVGADRDHPVPMDRVIAAELEIRGSHGMQAHAFPALLALIAQGGIDPGRLVRRRVSLEEGAAALIDMADHDQPGMTVIDRLG